MSNDAVNQATLGELIVHSTTRDIVIVLDGASALRVMAVFDGTASRALLRDALVPGRSAMTNLWTTIDFDRVVGLTWIPGLPSRADRTMAVDPPVPAGMRS